MLRPSKCKPAIYVTLPPNLIATWFPGYFWHTQEQQLYSLKVGGVLKPLPLCRPNRFNRLWEPAYRVSVKGRSRYMSHGQLAKLGCERSQIPVEKPQ